jgi:hypothetical protein
MTEDRTTIATISLAEETPLQSTFWGHRLIIHELEPKASTNATSHN